MCTRAKVFRLFMSTTASGMTRLRSVRWLPSLAAETAGNLDIFHRIAVPVAQREGDQCLGSKPSPTPGLRGDFQAVGRRRLRERCRFGRRELRCWWRSGSLGRSRATGCQPGPTGRPWLSPGAGGRRHRPGGQRGNDDNGQQHRRLRCKMAVAEQPCLSRTTHLLVLSSSRPQACGAERLLRRKAKSRADVTPARLA